MSSISNTAISESDRIENEFKKRWKKFNQIRPKPNNYQFRMSINHGAGSSNGYGGRMETNNNSIKFDLALVGNDTSVKQRPKSPASNPWTKLCSFGNSSKQHGQQALQLESGMIFSRMDKLERDIDALAKCIKKETKKKIAALKEAEEQAAAAAAATDAVADAAEEEVEEDNSTPPPQKEKPSIKSQQTEEIINVQDSAENIQPRCSSDNSKPVRVKTKTKTVHKENIIGADGAEEDIVVSKRELLDEGPIKQKRVVTTKEEHSFDEKKGYTVITNEKYVKDKGGKYLATKKEVIKGKDVNQGKKKQDDPNAVPNDTVQSNQKYSSTEHRLEEDGTKHEVVTRVQEKSSPKKQSKKIVTEHKAEGPRTDGDGGEAFIYEKTTTDVVEKKR